MYDTDQFYPTPYHVVDKMVGYLQFQKLYPILEPSAGRGDILDRLRQIYPLSLRQVFAIEKDIERRYILQGKGYKVIGSNILEFEEPITFQSILMNPPFNDQIDHILKCFALLNNGGILISVVKSSILDSNDKKTKLLQEICLNNDFILDDLGTPFENSDRRTKVKCSLLVIIKNKKPEEVIDNSRFSFDDIKPGDFDPAALAQRDIVKDVVARYKFAVQALKDKYMSQVKLKEMVLSVAGDWKDNLTKVDPFEDQLADLKKHFWEYIFRKTEIKSKTPSGFQHKWNSFISNQVQLEFSEENIKELLLLIYETRNQVMDEAIIKVYETISKCYFGTTKNREGWKTNKSWKIEKKIILDWCLSAYGNITRHGEDTLNDLDKIMCFLTGVDISTIKRTELAVRAGESESHFFLIKTYKKGTVHLVFKNEKALQDLNVKIANLQGSLLRASH